MSNFFSYQTRHRIIIFKIIWGNYPYKFGSGFADKSPIFDNFLPISEINAKDNETRNDD